MRTCENVCTHVGIYIVYACMHRYIDIHQHRYIDIYQCMYIYVYVWIYAYMCINLYICKQKIQYK